MKTESVNVQVVYDDGFCTQCGTCTALCPNDAIQMQLDINAGYVLSVDGDSCRNCGLCYEICPGHTVDFGYLSDLFLGDGIDNWRIGRYLSIYSGYTIQEKLRWEAASGGIVTALLIAALKTGEIDGALVTRMDPESPIEPQTILARTEEHIYEARGSKYCPVAANLCLRDILDADGKYAVVGLPCHIQGLRKAQMKNRRLREKVAITISIFCGLNMSPMGTRMTLRRYGISEQDVRDIRYRGAGWPGEMQVELKDGKTFTKGYRTYFDNHFMAYEMHRCNLCTDSFGELADISCGDAWLPEFTDSDDQGTSVVVIRSQRGKEFFSAHSPGVLALEPLSVDKAAQSQRKALMWKKEWLGAKFALTKLTGKETPEYKNTLPSTQPTSYIAWSRTVFVRYLHRVWHRLKGLNHGKEKT